MENTPDIQAAIDGAEAIKNIELPRSKIADFCQRWKILELALFGSVLRNDFRPDSDIDVLVSFEPESHWTLLHLVRMKDELKVIFGRDVDLVCKKAIEQSRNYLRRQAILSSAKVIYERTRSSLPA